MTWEGAAGPCSRRCCAGIPRSAACSSSSTRCTRTRRATLAARGVTDRCELVAGDFFASVAGGCDLYILQAVIHDWDDDRCVEILTNVRNAMSLRAPGARLLVIENLLDADGREKDKLTRGFDLLMLVLTGSGRERTLAQFEALFARAGLRLDRDITLPSLLHVLEVSPRSAD